MNSKKYGCISILLVAFAIYTFYNGAFLSPKGNLLCSYHQAYSPKYSDGVYIVPFDKAKPVQLFFEMEGSWAYGYPFIQDEKFFCRLLRNNKNAEEGVDSTLIMVDDYKNNISDKNEIQILMEVQGFVESPVVTKDLSTIYYRKKDKLFKFDRKTGKESKVNEDKIETFSKFLLVGDQNVIYTKVDSQQKGWLYGKKYSIVELYPNGETKVLIENGKFPAWYEKDKSIIYSNDQYITYIYNLMTGEREEIGPNTWVGSPIVSPDQEYLLVERKNPDASPSGGDESWYIYFVTQLRSAEMKKLRDEGYDYNGVPFWLED